MADHHPGQIDPFLEEHPLLVTASVGGHIGVGGDGHPGLAVSPGAGPQHALDAGRETQLVGGALDDGRLHPGAGDALGDVLDEHRHHRLGTLDQCPRSGPQPEEEREVVVGVQPRGGHDVELGLLGDALEARDVPAEPDHGGVDDRVDAPALQLVQLRDGVGDALLLVPELGVVLEDLGAQHEHVLVHERRAQGTGLDGAADGLDGGHCLCASSVGTPSGSGSPSEAAPLRCAASLAMVTSPSVRGRGVGRAGARRSRCAAPRWCHRRW